MSERKSWAGIEEAARRGESVTLSPEDVLCLSSDLAALMRCAAPPHGVLPGAVALRDHFAMAALPIIESADPHATQDEVARRVARTAYRMADAMLKAREGK